MQTVNVSIRRDRGTSRPVLFFYDSGDLYCYDRIGQHSSASIGYLRQCAPIRTLDGPALALLREWARMGEPVNARPVLRLSRA